ncbi:hypothetical protein BDV11DRAFT_172841 [Aspergillus similis]
MLLILNVSRLPVTGIKCTLCIVVRLFRISLVPKIIPRTLKKLTPPLPNYWRSQRPLVMPSATGTYEIVLLEEHSTIVLFAKESKYSFKAHVFNF